MDELTKIVLQTHTEALIQILYRLPNPPKAVTAKLYSVLEKLGARAPRSNQADIQPNHDYPHYTKNPQIIDANAPISEPPAPSNITPAIAEALLQEAKERQLKAREQRTRQRLPENIIADDPMRPENDLSDF